MEVAEVTNEPEVDHEDTKVISVGKADNVHAEEGHSPTILGDDAAAGFSGLPLGGVGGGGGGVMVSTTTLNAAKVILACNGVDVTPSPMVVVIDDINPIAARIADGTARNIIVDKVSGILPSPNVKDHTR